MKAARKVLVETIFQIKESFNFSYLELLFPAGFVQGRSSHLTLQTIRFSREMRFTHVKKLIMG